MDQARHDADSYRRVELITGGRRRRDWSDAEKARIIAESVHQDANISEVARRNGVSRGLLTVWRRQAREASRVSPMFAKVQIESPAVGAVGGGPDAGAASETKIEIEIADARVRVPTSVDVGTLRNVISALRSAR